MGVFAYSDPETNATIYYVMPNAESEDALSSFGSETDSSTSWVTIQSDDLPGYFVLHHGRPQAASDSVAKWFPSDNIQRPVILYFIIRQLFGGDYVGPVQDVLAPLAGEQRQVLELGTRTGTWIQSMAAQFPHVQFRTLDVVPMVPHVPCHNIEFEVCDFGEELPFESNSQDAVFLSGILDLVKDYRAVLREAYRVLRPGGLIHVREHDLRAWDPDDLSKVAQLSSQTCRYFSLFQTFIAQAGIELNTSEKIPQWLAPGSEVWDSGQKGFAGIHTVTPAHPAYPHDGFPCMDHIDPRLSPSIRRLAEISMRDMCGVMMDCGLEDKGAQKLISDSLEELRDHENCGFMKVSCVYATKI